LALTETLNGLAETVYYTLAVAVVVLAHQENPQQTVIQAEMAAQGYLVKLLVHVLCMQAVVAPEPTAPVTTDIMVFRVLLEASTVSAGVEVVVPQVQMAEPVVPIPEVVVVALFIAVQTYRARAAPELLLLDIEMFKNYASI
jgi:hypothetical protein